MRYDRSTKQNQDIPSICYIKLKFMVLWCSSLAAYIFCINTLHPSQQCFSHVRMFSCLTGFNQYSAEDKCLAPGHSTVSLVGLKLASPLTLYH